MATTKKTTVSKPRAASSAQATVLEPAEHTQSAPIVAKEIDIHEYITVKSGCQGKLIYKSPRTGEKFVWEDFGDEQEIELQELKNAKSSGKKFFENNWFMFDAENDWVIDYLGLRQFYRNALTLDNFDYLFKKNPAEMTKVIAGLSNGQKRSVAYRARQLIESGEIDSNKAISALEKALDTELIER